jgi:hypothetical protein
MKSDDIDDDQINDDETNEDPAAKSRRGAGGGGRPKN